MYGLESGNANQATATATPQTDVAAAASAPTVTATPSSASGFQNPGNAQVIGETPTPLYSTANLASLNSDSLAYSGFNITDGAANISGVKIRLARTLTASAGSISAETLSFK